MSPVERALFLGRRRELWKARYPELRRGFHGGGRPKTVEHQLPFVEQEAERLGIAQDTCCRYLAIYTAVGEFTLMRVFNTALDTFTGLNRLRRAKHRVARERMVEAYAKPLRKQRTLEIRI